MGCEAPVSWATVPLGAGVIWPMPPGVWGRIEVGAAPNAPNSYTAVGGAGR